jgi:hypothetical protein
LTRFIEDSGLKVRAARRKLGDRRFLYGADVLLERVKDRLDEKLGQDPGLFRSVPEPVLSLRREERPPGSWLEQPAELSRRIRTLHSIVDQLARERRAESTLWEDIVNILQVLSTFVPGPIGWGIRQGVAAASFDIAVGRASEQRLLQATELSTVAEDPDAGVKALGEAAFQMFTDVPSGIRLGAGLTAKASRATPAAPRMGPEVPAFSTAVPVPPPASSIAAPAIADARIPNAGSSFRNTRISPTDRGWGARPFYAKDPKHKPSKRVTSGPRPTGTPDERLRADVVAEFIAARKRGVPDQPPAGLPPPRTSVSRHNVEGFHDRVLVGDLENGKATYVVGTLEPADLHTGTPTGGVYPLGLQPGELVQHDAARGHLLGNLFGGSGTHEGNLAWMHSRINLSDYKVHFENPVHSALKKGQTVDFSIRPLFREGDAAPYAIEVWARTPEGEIVPLQPIPTPALADVPMPAP